MVVILSLIVVLLAGVGIFQIRSIAAAYKFTTHKNALIDKNIKFQSTQLILAGIVLLIVYFLSPENFKTFFQFGNVYARIGKIAWLGVTGNETWLEIALGMGFFITLATGIFMYLQVKKAGIKISGVLMNSEIWFWVIIFSAMNAFSEEVIFRMGIVFPLYSQMATPVILLISGIVFGLPHYFGQPSGMIGVLMAGFLGWLLAMSVVETQGIFLAWAIHFVQDIVIIFSIFAMQIKGESR